MFSCLRHQTQCQAKWEAALRSTELLDGKYGHLQLDFKACYLGVGDHLLASFLFITSFITKVGRVLNCLFFLRKS